MGTLPAGRLKRPGLAKDKQADCMVSQVCCSGCVEVAPHSTGAVLVMETNHRKEGRQSSSTHVPGD